MEAGDSTSRQSGHPSASTSTTSERPSLPHQSPFQPSREPSSMASASVLLTGNSFQQPAFPNSRPGSGGSGISKLMSSNDALRKPSEDNDSGRQSLPSISEVISATKPQFPQPPPSSSSLPPSSSLPSPFPPAARAYAETDPRGSPHPASFPTRQENLASFSSSPRSASFSGRSGLPPIPDRRSSPHRPDGQAHGVNDPHAHNGGYAHHSQPPPPPPPPLAMGYQQNGHLPAGQVPLPGYTASPRHAGPPPPPPGPYDPRSSQHDDIDLSARQRYESTVNRHFENWGYTDTLTRVAASSRTIFNFAEAYGRLASETNPAHLHTDRMPSDRMPSDREVGDMLANVELMKQSLEQIRDVVQASIRKERALVGANAKMGGYDDQEDVSMCADGLKPQYPLVEVKKRRGRAAPPGRCHSCNRIDTPEWRRGPDGARTLCNACGLHYAKLERKRQLEARSIRPKPEDRAS